MACYTPEHIHALKLNPDSIVTSPVLMVADKGLFIFLKIFPFLLGKIKYVCTYPHSLWIEDVTLINVNL